MRSGAWPRRSPVSLLGDARVSRRRQVRLGKLLKLAEGRHHQGARALCFCAGVLAGEQGDYVSADTLIRESLDIARQLRDKQGVAVSLNALAVHARDRGDVAVAQSLLEEAKCCGENWATRRLSLVLSVTWRMLPNCR